MVSFLSSLCNTMLWCCFFGVLRHGNFSSSFSKLACVTPWACSCASAPLRYHVQVAATYRTRCVYRYARATIHPVMPNTWYLVHGTIYHYIHLTGQNSYVRKKFTSSHSSDNILHTTPNRNSIFFFFVIVIYNSVYVMLSINLIII